MKLIYSPASPFARKVLITILETGQKQAVDLTTVTTMATAPSTELKAVNPLAKIPALALDDGTAIYDSRVICRYLDDKAGSGLYPKDDLWDLLTLEATADGIMEAALLMVYEGRIRPAELVYAPWVEAQWCKVEAGIAALSTRWIDMLHGPLNMGQIAVACALGYVDFRLGHRDWRSANPDLAKWYAEFAKRESMQETWPPAS